MPRQKTVFKSRELPHLWAHKLNPVGRCSSSMSFDGNFFYSYSTQIGRIIERAGKRAYLVNDTSYSVTTSVHRSRMFMLIPNNAEVFHIAELGFGKVLENITGRDIFNFYIKKAAVMADKATRARSHKEWILKCQFENLAKAKQVNSFFKLRRKIDETVIEKLRLQIKDANEKRLAAEKLKQIQLEKDNAEKISRWLAGENVNLPYYLNKVYLRANKQLANADSNLPPTIEVMETSRGVTVPLEDAKRAFRFVMSKRQTGWKRNGENFSIGQFQLDSVNDFGVIAGCHRVEWAEIERFSKLMGWTE